MKKIILTRSIVITVMLIAVYVPTLVFAQAAFNCNLKDCQLTAFVSNLLKGAVTLALPFVAVYIIYSGFLFVFAQGNQEKLSRAKENFLWVILGSCLILGSWMFAELLASTAATITGNDAPTNAAKMYRGR